MASGKVFFLVTFLGASTASVANTSKGSTSSGWIFLGDSNSKISFIDLSSLISNTFFLLDDLVDEWLAETLSVSFFGLRLITLGVFSVELDLLDKLETEEED